MNNFQISCSLLYNYIKYRPGSVLRVVNENDHLGLVVSGEKEEGKIAKLNDHALKLSKSFNKVFVQHGLEESKEIFLVARNSLNHWTSDNEKLKDQILTDLPEIQKTAFGQ